MSKVQVHREYRKLSASHARQTRPYRSRRNRPCTLCRARKVLCRRECESDASCLSCRKADLICSFSERPSDDGDGLESGAIGPSGVNLAQESRLVNDVGLGSGMVRYPEQMNANQRLVLWDHPDEDFGLNINLDDLNNGTWMDLSYPNADFNGRQSDTTPQAWHDEPSTQVPPDWHGWQSHQRVRSASGPGTRSSNRGSPGMESSASNAHSSKNSSPEKTPHASLTSDGVSPTEPSNSKSVDVGNKEDITISLDRRRDFHAVHVGLSGEIDPYLFQYLLYKDTGEFLFSKHMHRTVVPTKIQASVDQSDFGSVLPPSVPTQFLFTSNDVGDDAKKLAPIHLTDEDKAAQKSLDHLVSPVDVRRLIPLFLEHLFPALPVISRSEFAAFISSPDSIQIQESQLFPPYLLAAIYASSMSFGSYDAHICLSKMWGGYSTRELWQVAYNGIVLEMQTPRLATISAALLYLNKAPIDVQVLSTDSPFVWSFMASIVALATSLGLHLDCSGWSIPNWEKRLRRRLWWTVYSEEKWRSLLMGRPSLIHNDQWNVSELVADDFEIDTHATVHDLPQETETLLQTLETIRPKSENGLLFRHLIRLACIIDDVATTLYTIRAVQTLAGNLQKSVETVKPLRERLTCWYSNLPPSLQMYKNNTKVSATNSINSNACLQFAYMVAEIFVYRALVRPLGSIDFDEQQKQGQSDEQLTNVMAQTEAILSAAENCASLITSYVEGLVSRDFAGFWYSWSRIGFATTSNFVTMLLVQAPSAEHATTSRRLADNWKQTLTYQSRSFPYMILGAVRMNSMHWSRLKVFRENKLVESQ